MRKRKKVSEIEGHKINSGEGDEIGTQEIERKQRRRKTGGRERRYRNDETKKKTRKGRRRKEEPKVCREIT